MESMGDYHDVNLKTDVLVLAVVFEEFRSICLEFYALDHISSGSLGCSWDKMTGV